MKKERLFNTFSGVIVDKTHVRFLNHVFDCPDASTFPTGHPITVNVDFHDIILFDDEEDGLFGGDVKFILYKGNHYHLTVSTGGNENITIVLVLLEMAGTAAMVMLSLAVASFQLALGAM